MGGHPLLRRQKLQLQMPRHTGHTHSGLARASRTFSPYLSHSTHAVQSDLESQLQSKPQREPQCDPESQSRSDPQEMSSATQSHSHSHNQSHSVSLRETQSPSHNQWNCRSMVKQ